MIRLPIFFFVAATENGCPIHLHSNNPIYRPFVLASCSRHQMEQRQLPPMSRSRQPGASPRFPLSKSVTPSNCGCLVEPKDQCGLVHLEERRADNLRSRWATGHGSIPPEATDMLRGRVVVPVGVGEKRLRKMMTYVGRVQH